MEDQYDTLLIALTQQAIRRGWVGEFNPAAYAEAHGVSEADVQMDLRALHAAGQITGHRRPSGDIGAPVITDAAARELMFAVDTDAVLPGYAHVSSEVIGELVMRGKMTTEDAEQLLGMSRKDIQPHLHLMRMMGHLRGEVRPGGIIFSFTS